MKVLGSQRPFRFTDGDESLLGKTGRPESAPHLVKNPGYVETNVTESLQSVYVLPFNAARA